MSDIAKKKPSGTVKNEKVIGSIVARSVSPENRKKIIQLAKEKARERGFIINVIEK